MTTKGGSKIPKNLTTLFMDDPYEWFVWLQITKCRSWQHQVGSGRAWSITLDWIIEIIHCLKNIYIWRLRFLKMWLNRKAQTCQWNSRVHAPLCQKYKSLKSKRISRCNQLYSCYYSNFYTVKRWLFWAKLNAIIV